MGLLFILQKSEKAIVKAEVIWYDNKKGFSRKRKGVVHCQDYLTTLLGCYMGFPLF